MLYYSDLRGHRSYVVLPPKSAVLPPKSDSNLRQAILIDGQSIHMSVILFFNFRVSHWMNPRHIPNFIIRWEFWCVLKFGKWGFHSLSKKKKRFRYNIYDMNLFLYVYCMAMAIRRAALHISSVAMLIRRAALHISSVAMLIRRAALHTSSVAKLIRRAALHISSVKMAYLQSIRRTSTCSKSNISQRRRNR